MILYRTSPPGPLTRACRGKYHSTHYILLLLLLLLLGMNMVHIFNDRRNRGPSHSNVPPLPPQWSSTKVYRKMSFRYFFNIIHNNIIIYYIDWNESTADFSRQTTPRRSHRYNLLRPRSAGTTRREYLAYKILLNCDVRS